MTISIRQANADRELRFEALADFANLGDTPEHWRRFRSKHPHFFPETPSGWDQPGFRNLTDWIYAAAEDWDKESADLIKQQPEMAGLRTPLLWYRDRLQAVWTRNDDGRNLRVLLGFEKETGGLGALVRPVAVPGQRAGFEDTIGGLPRGRQIVKPDPITGLEDLPGLPTVQMTGRIEWEFACPFQQGVYELMQCRWRAKVCPECKRFFIAKKTAQKHCSPNCSQQRKVSASLEYYYAAGKEKREERREDQASSRKSRK